MDYNKITSLYNIINDLPVLKPEYNNTRISIYNYNNKLLHECIIINKITLYGSHQDPDIRLHCENGLMIEPSFSYKFIVHV